MAYGPSLARPVADLVWPAAEGTSRALRPFVLAFIGSMLLWTSAKVQMPFHPVPLTLQTAVVFMIGIAYGPRLGAMTILLYLGMGLIGLPVFAGSPVQGTGLSHLAGPTGGYLLGFVPAAVITGWTTTRRTHWSEVAGGVLVATCAIYLCGISWLASFVGWKNALEGGMAPFLAGDLVTIVLVTVACEASLAIANRRWCHL